MKGEHLPLEQYYELPQELIEGLRARGLKQGDLDLIAMLENWVNKEKEKFKYLPTDDLRLMQRRASLYLKAVEGAEPEIARELLKFAIEDLQEAQIGTIQMSVDEEVESGARGKLILPELERQIKTTTEQRRKFGIESGPEIAEFERLIDAFESHFSLEELTAIIDVRNEVIQMNSEEKRAELEAMNIAEVSKLHPIREPARLHLIPIVARLNRIKEETNVTPEKFKELDAQYKKLSRAVGHTGSNDMLRHQ